MAGSRAGELDGRRSLREEPLRLPLSSGPLIPGGDHGPRHGGYAISAYEALTWRVRTRSARRSSQGSPLGSAARQPHYERPRAVLLPFSFVGARLQLPQLVRGCNTSPLARQCFAVATLALGPEPEVGRRAANRTVNGAFDLLRPLRSGEADIRRPSAGLRSGPLRPAQKDAIRTCAAVVCCVRTRRTLARFPTASIEESVGVG